MVVKYYGYGDTYVDQQGRQWKSESVINVLYATRAESLASRCEGTPTASVWMVPGTFDLEGRHVG